MICSLTAFNRPEYLEQVLESLEHAIAYCPEPVFLVASVDGPGSDVQAEILNMLPQGRGNYKYLSTQNLGLQKNTLRALDEAWAVADRLGEDFLVHLEDDLVLAPDALRLSCWMRDQFRDKAAFIGLTQVNYVPDESDYPEVLLSEWFDCHVWGTWRWVWETHLRPDWPHEWTTHWAARVNERQMWGGLQVLPKLSRSKSVGEFGTHCGPEAHKVHNPKVYAGDVLTSMPEAYVPVLVS